MKESKEEAAPVQFIPSQASEVKEIASTPLLSLSSESLQNDVQKEEESDDESQSIDYTLQVGEAKIQAISLVYDCLPTAEIEAVADLITMFAFKQISDLFEVFKYIKENNCSLNEYITRFRSPPPQIKLEEASSSQVNSVQAPIHPSSNIQASSFSSSSIQPTIHPSSSAQAPNHSSRILLPHLEQDSHLDRCILRICAHLAPGKNIPFIWLEKKLVESGRFSKLGLTLEIRSLRDRGLILFSDEEKFLRITPENQIRIRNRLQLDANPIELKDLLLWLATISSQHGGSRHLNQDWRDFAPHLEFMVEQYKNSPMKNDAVLAVALNQLSRILEAQYSSSTTNLQINLLTELNALYGKIGDLNGQMKSLERLVAVKDKLLNERKIGIEILLPTLKNLIVVCGIIEGGKQKKADYLNRLIRLERQCGNHEDAAKASQELSITYHELSLEAAKTALHFFNTDIAYGPKHNKTKDCLRILKERCGFSQALLKQKKANSSSSGEQKSFTAAAFSVTSLPVSNSSTQTQVSSSSFADIATANPLASRPQVPAGFQVMHPPAGSPIACSPQASAVRPPMPLIPQPFGVQPNLFASAPPSANASQTGNYSTAQLLTQQGFSGNSRRQREQEAQNPQAVQPAELEQGNQNTSKKSKK